MIEYTNSAMREAIEENVHSERDRLVLSRRFIDGVTFEHLAEEFDMSVSQIKRIIYGNSPILFMKIRK